MKSVATGHVYVAPFQGHFLFVGVPAVGFSLVIRMLPVTFRSLCIEGLSNDFQANGGPERQNKEKIARHRNDNAEFRRRRAVTETFLGIFVHK
jgi:hypothetical protein